MTTINFTEKELKAVIFALRNDLETVLNSPDDFPGEERALETALHKLEAVKE